MKTFGTKQRRMSFLPRVRLLPDPVEDNEALPSIVEYIDNLIEEAPEVLKKFASSKDIMQKKMDTDEEILSPEPGMIFISQPSQVYKKLP